MPIQKYYPPLTDLIDASALPGNLESVESFLNEGIDLILGRIYYKDFAVQVLKSGDSRYFSLTILTKTIKLPLVADINLVFFRNVIDPTQDIDVSEFPILFEWTWPLRKYISNFEVQGFSYAPEAFLDVLIELSEIQDRAEFFSRIVSVFLNDGGNTYQGFLDAISSTTSSYDNGEAGVSAEVNTIVNQLDIIKAEVQTQLTATNLFTIEDIFDRYKTNSILGPAVESIEDSISILQNQYSVSINLYSDVLSALIGGLSDFDEKFDKLLDLFRNWMQDIDGDDLRDFLIPQFTIELQNINMGMEFPRNWLIPAIENNLGVYIQDPDITHKSALIFTAGTVRYSTKLGFQFDYIPSFAFQKSFIGKTGLMLEFDNLKVDMSKAYNIPEADADGRPQDFQGFYAQSAAVTLPKKWFNDASGSTLAIVGRNLLVGTGGISGTIALQAVGGGTPGTDDYLDFKIGNWQIAC